MILTTERLILRPWEDTDAEQLFELAKDARVGLPTGWQPHKDVHESIEVLHNILEVPETYAVCRKEDYLAIGSISLMQVKSSNLDILEGEGELGYWLGFDYWGHGYIPEASRELMRHAFCDLHLHTLWCGRFEENEKSKRVQEKLGFRYHHTNYEMNWKPLGTTVTEIVTVLPYDEWLVSTLQIVKLSERKELKERAAKWFASKWSVPEKAYEESIEDSYSNDVPSWYVCLDGSRIVAGLGVIENDFHEREDLTPNVCAVYTEEGYRGIGLAGRLLNYVVNDMHTKGIDTLYLVTDHDSFYERYGWQYFCPVMCDGEDKPSRMYIHKYASD